MIRLTDLVPYHEFDLLHGLVRVDGMMHFETCGKEFDRLSDTLLWVADHDRKRGSVRQVTFRKSGNAPLSIRVNDRHGRHCPGLQLQTVDVVE